MEDLTKEGAGSGERSQAYDARHPKAVGMCLVIWSSRKESLLN